MTTNLQQLLQKEIPIHEANIRALYAGLDKKYHLSGAQIPITFGFDTDVLGSYTREGVGEEEHFHFSLLFRKSYPRPQAPRTRRASYYLFKRR